MERWHNSYWVDLVKTFFNVFRFLLLCIGAHMGMVLMASPMVYSQTNLTENMVFNHLEEGVILRECTIRANLIFVNTKVRIENCILEDVSIVISNDRVQLKPMELASFVHNSWKRSARSSGLTIDGMGQYQFIEFVNNLFQWASGKSVQITGEVRVTGKNNAWVSDEPLPNSFKSLKKWVLLPWVNTFPPEEEQRKALQNKGAYQEQLPVVDIRGRLRGLRPDIGAEEW